MEATVPQGGGHVLVRIEAPNGEVREWDFPCVFESRWTYYPPNFVNDIRKLRFDLDVGEEFGWDVRHFPAPIRGHVIPGVW